MKDGARPFEQIDRCLFPAGDDALRVYARRHLIVPHRAVDRAMRLMPAGLQDTLAGGAIRKWLFSSGGDVIDSSPAAGAEESARAADTFSLWRRAIEAGALECLPRGRAALQARFILCADSANSSRQQLLAFVFDGDRDVPCAAIKVRPHGPAADRLARECDAVGRVSRLPPRLQTSVPQLLSCVDDGQIVALTLSAVHGRSAYGEMHASLIPAFRVGRHLRAALEWVAELQDATRRNTPFDVEREEDRLVAAVVGGESWARDLIRAAAQRLRRDAHPRTLRTVWSHGDFWARNLLLNGGTAAAGVVDWEDFEVDAPPFYDVFHFVTTYGLAYRWPGPSNTDEAFRRTFFECNRISRAVRHYLARYCLRTGLAPAVLPSLLALYVARQHSAAATTRRFANRADVWMHCLRLLATDSRPAFCG